MKKVLNIMCMFKVSAGDIAVSVFLFIVYCDAEQYWNSVISEKVNVLECITCIVQAPTVTCNIFQDLWTGPTYPRCGKGNTPETRV